MASQAIRQQESSVPSRGGLLRRLLPLLLIVALLVAAWSALVPDELPVRRVRVESPLEHLKAEELRQTLAPQVGEGLLSVDVEQLHSSLEALPWVYRASVRRAWPDALVVRIEEQQALARWRDGGLVNRHGEAFAAPTADWQQGLPLLAGPEGSSLLLSEYYREMSRMLDPLGLAIRALVLDERRAWALELDNGWRVLLGRHQTYPRLLRFVRIYTNNLAERREAIAQIDLRYTNGFAVRWKETTA